MEKVLADDDFQEFKGVQLEIKEEYKYDLNDLNNIKGKDTDEHVARLNLSNSDSDNETQKNNNIKSSSVLSGSDTISPINLTPKKQSNNNSNVNNNESENDQRVRQDIVIAKPFENEDPRNYFSFRSGLVESAIKECKDSFISPEEDGKYIGSWLLTEINLWDNEKERLILLSERYVTTVKYDFIALKQLEYRKVSLSKIDTIVIGDLVYPSNSLIPRFNGIANGVTTMVRGYILERWSRESAQEHRSFDFSHFEPRDRGFKGIRLMWNDGKPLSFTKRWNPFAGDIPFTTFTSHPLFWRKENQDECRDIFDIDHFIDKIKDAVHYARETRNIHSTNACKIYYKPIILENYVGFGSVIHNKNSLGFFKVRGKFSF